MEARWPSTVDRCGLTEQPTNRAGDNLSDELRLLVAGLLARSSSVTLQTVRRDRLDITEPCQMRGTHESKGPRWEQNVWHSTTIFHHRTHRFFTHGLPADLRCLFGHEFTTTPLQRSKPRITNGCTTNGGWCVQRCGRFGFPPSRDPYRYTEKRFTFDCIATTPNLTETSAVAIALSMAFDVLPI